MENENPQGTAVVVVSTQPQSNLQPASSETERAEQLEMGRVLESNRQLQERQAQLEMENSNLKETLSMQGQTLNRLEMELSEFREAVREAETELEAEPEVIAVIPQQEPPPPPEPEPVREPNLWERIAAELNSI